MNDAPYLMQALRRRQQPEPTYFQDPEEDNFAQAMLRRLGKKVGSTAKQIGHDIVVGGPQAMRQVAENVVPTLAVINRLRQPAPSQQAEVKEGPWYGGGTSDPGAILLATAAGFAGPGKKPPKLSRPLPSGQKELPGMQTSSAQRAEQAAADLERARQDQSFITPSLTTPRIFEHRVGSDTGRDFYRVRDTTEDDPGPFGSQRGGPSRTIAPPDQMSPPYYQEIGQQMRSSGMGDEYNQAMDRLEALEGARQNAARARGVAAGDERARLAAQVRALRAEMPSDIAGQNRQLEEMLALTRAKPIVSEQKEVYRFDPESSYYTREGSGDGPIVGPYSVNDIDTSTRLQMGMVEQALRELIPARREARMLEEFIAEDPRRATPELPNWIRALTSQPEPKSAQGSAQVFKDLGHPDAIMLPTTREATEAFLGGARENEALFQYGLAPRSSDMEEIAAHHGRAGGKQVNVEYRGGYSDEPEYIEQPKEHGRGERMRNRHGDYKTEEHEPGDILRDDRGNPKMREVKGPPTREQFEEGEHPQAKKIAEGGEVKRDEDGNVVYQKSRGGEYVRDERGRRKMEEVENEDYSEDAGEGFNLSIPREGNIDYDPGAEHIHATEAGGKGAGQLLYQIANSYAIRNNLNIGSKGLTPDNQYRLLSNQLSTFARHGRNPRDLSETRSGDRPPAVGLSRELYSGRDPRRNQGTGFDIWNAEVGEGEERLLRANEDPGRVAFTGEGFTLDGKRVSVKDIDAQIRAGNINKDVEHNKVGAKSWARIAVLKYLEQATPQMARQLAQDWPKELGPLFASVAAATPLISALRSEPEAD